jgi:hypothetical protein
MDMNLELHLVTGEFDESAIELDDDKRVTGTLRLRGDVDDDWRAAFASAGAGEAPWEVDVTGDTPVLRLGPIPIEEFADRVGELRDQVKEANASVEVPRHQAAMAAHIDALERQRIRQQAVDTLSTVFSRRLG